ncbi:hypothetical protein LPB140_02670 [Sphingorhabdus lutea]|uniref:SDR family oxidoreductase n=1 Tax=Sphingorhabdus lutea TaxID=1913578 RepID=A0A1L3J9W1_9SPHN|nr:SDR family oxidoreductase [Sphingorhabdus lutea]APG61908.1 hypothetical protein LPB140_02670 [Sphingorhabdus lutea]
MTISARPLAIVTGGFRRLGAHIAAHLAAQGYDLILCASGALNPDPILKQAIEKYAPQIHPIHIDLSDENAVQKLMEIAINMAGRIPDLLVNNAANFGQDVWQSMNSESLTTQFAVNYNAPVILAQNLVAASPDGHCPAIINILDQRIRNPHGDQISYTLSKQALAASIRTLAVAFGPHARINGVAPGLTIDTADYAVGQAERLASLMPLQRHSSPQSIANAVHFLAQSHDVTGQIIYVDGGAHLRSFDRDFMHL